jgi:hypothetical protein
MNQVLYSYLLLSVTCYWKLIHHYVQWCVYSIETVHSNCKISVLYIITPEIRFLRETFMAVINIRLFVPTGVSKFRDWLRIQNGVEHLSIYEAVSKSFRTGRLERGLQIVQLSATSCSCIAILWVSLVSFAAISCSVASQRVFIDHVYFVIDSIRKLLDTPSFFHSTLIPVIDTLDWNSGSVLGFLRETSLRFELFSGLWWLRCGVVCFWDSQRVGWCWWTTCSR